MKYLFDFLSKQGSDCGRERVSSRFFAFLMTMCLAAATWAQTPVNLTVNVSAVTGQSVAGLKVDLANEQYGIVYQTVTLTASGQAKFQSVLTGVNKLSIDGTSVGLENYVNSELEVTEDKTTIDVVLSENVRTPYNLNAVLSHDPLTGKDAVALDWNDETDYFFDDFEDYEAFSINFAPWTGYDGDKEPAAQIQGTYPNAGIAQYATIFNCLTIDPPVYYDYPVLRPYSGKQYVGFVRTLSGNANNDWLISPKIKVGVNNVVSFMAKAADVTKERFNVLVSTKSTDISDFVSLTSGNYQTVDYKYWVDITYSLAAYEGQEVYIAIQCVSSGGFMLMVDDFYVGPESKLYGAPKRDTARRVARRSADNPYERFNIYVDNAKVGETDDTGYTIEDIAEGTHQIAVESVYQVSNGGRAETEVYVPGLMNYHSLSAEVTNQLGKKLPFKMTVISMTSDQVTTVEGDGTAVIPSLATGEYSLNIAADGYEEHTDKLTLDIDCVLNITLNEDTSAPYNLAFDAETLTLSWNRDLGYTEGFEDYDDFSQAFGEWTVVDGDQMPTYAIGIGSDVTILTTPETRGLVGAMIFNPDKTEPVKASIDALFTAPEGDKYVMFSSAEQATSDDWLISPIQAISDDYVARFTSKSYSASYPGRYEFGVMTDPNDLTTFVALDAMDMPSDWARYELSLAAYSGQKVAFAFHHTSTDQWISFVDDIYIGPAETTEGSSSANATYRVYLDGMEVATTDQCQYTFDKLTPGSHTLGVRAVYQTGESAVTTIEVNIASGVSDVQADAADVESTLYDLQGRCVHDTPSPGVYLRRQGAETTKVIIK